MFILNTIVQQIRYVIICNFSIPHLCILASPFNNGLNSMYHYQWKQAVGWEVSHIIFAFVFIQHIGVSPGEFAFSVFSTFSSPNALDSVHDVFKYDEAPTEK